MKKEPPIAEARELMDGREKVLNLRSEQLGYR